MWYSCLEERWNPHRRKSRSAYAVSRDGIAWERPNLGLTSYQGSRQNNLLPYSVGRVFLDARETEPSRRFKALGYGRVREGEPGGLLISFSSDGLTWTPHPDNPLLSQPREGGGTHPGIGDTHTILGWDDHWDRQDLPLLTHPAKKPPESLSEQSWLERRRGFGGLAVSRRDGFVSLDSGSPLGILVTKPFTLRGQKLLINADASRGRFRVEVQDSQGDPTEGFAASDSDVFRGDSLRHVASWKGKQDLSSLKGEVIKVRLLMTNSKLYSFTLSETE